MLFSYSYDGNIKVWSIRELVGLKPEERPESDSDSDSDASSTPPSPPPVKNFNEKPNGAAMSAFTVTNEETEAKRPARAGRRAAAQQKMQKAQAVAAANE